MPPRVHRPAQEPARADSRSAPSGIVALIGSDASSPPSGIQRRAVASVSLRQALESRVGAANVRYAPGPGRTASDVVTVPTDYLWRDSSGTRVHGLDAEYFDDPDMNSAPRVRRPEPRIDFQWTLSSPAPEIAGDWFAARWTGTLTVPATGLRRIGVEGNDGYRLYLDEHVLVDQWQKVSFGRHVVAVKLTPGSSHRLRLEYHERNGNTKLKLVWDAGESSRSGQSIEAVVLAARAASVAIVAVGIEEGEFRDRASLRLPGAQEELIRRVAATGTPTIVVLFGGSAVTMSDWIDPVDAVLDAWYPGVQGGIAIADVLFGAVDPSGRLPLTFPISEGQLPLVYDHLPTGRGDDYLDLTGRPLFPFGYGLSYTDFTYSDLRIDAGNVRSGIPAVVTCRVQNTGQRPGNDVVQLYIKDVLASVARPVLQLAAFARVRLEPGASTDVTFRLPADQLQLLAADGRWTVEPGDFRILVGRSSQDIRLRGTLTVQ
ncbi:MAG: glycoside hydrolase family 3 C-terminal domain-containing protein [Gemmatimonadaceae bacterium]